MYVADAGERVKARAVGFPVASFEHVWYVKFFAYRGDCTETCKASQRFIAYCDSETERKDMIGIAGNKTDTAILIGPEGDFTADEVALARQHGFELHIGAIVPAMSIAICSPSMTQGPARRKKLFDSDDFRYSDVVILCELIDYVNCGLKK